MNELNEATLRFIRLHRTENPRTLALQAGRQADVNLSEALTQIAGWQTAREKVPTWAAAEEVRYPVHLSMEQCSSEATARYKQAVVTRFDDERRTLVDLTGGFGIDCSFLSRLFEQATYVERQAELCELARHNFPLLGLPHIDVQHCEATDFLDSLTTPADWIFIDPARRDSHGGKTVAIADCTPDIAALEEQLTASARRVLVKLSPMLDLTLALHTLHHVQEAHIVAAGSECKELLLVLSRHTPAPAPDEVPIHCIDLTNTELSTINFPLSTINYQLSTINFTRNSESAAPCPLADAPEAFLYEPNAALMKAGAFRTLAHRFGLKKLHPNSHLYTGSEYLADFPGRRFCIEAHAGFSKAELKQLLADCRKANLSVRNFPATVADLRKRLKLSEGGDLYLFATTVADGRKLLLRCRKA